MAPGLRLTRRSGGSCPKRFRYLRKRGEQPFVRHEQAGAEIPLDGDELAIVGRTAAGLSQLQDGVGLDLEFAPGHQALGLFLQRQDSV